MNILATTIALLSICTAAHSQPSDLELVGGQGDHYFFTLGAPWVHDHAYIRRSAENFCKNKPVCYVHFWEKGTASPKLFPLTDRETVEELGTFQLNRKTGRHRMLWNCRKFPATPQARCF